MSTKTPPLSCVPDAAEASGAGAWECDPEHDRLRGDRTPASLTHLTGEGAEHGVPVSRFYDPVHSDDRGLTVAKRSPVIGRGGRVVAKFRAAVSSRRFRRLVARGWYRTHNEGHAGHGRVSDVTESRDIDPANSTVAVAADPDPALTPLDRVADHVLAARRAIDALGVQGLALRPAIDALLIQVGQQLATANTATTPVDRN